MIERVGIAVVLTAFAVTPTVPAAAIDDAAAEFGISSNLNSVFYTSDATALDAAVSFRAVAEPAILATMFSALLTATMASRH